MRRPQPAQPDRHARVVGADECDFLAGGIKDAEHEKQIGVGGLG